MATARIILRGLCAFLFNEDKDKVAVLLVNDPRSSGTHAHVPRVRWIGADPGTGEVVAPDWERLMGTLSFSSNGEVPSGLSRPENFGNYVPTFTDLGATSNKIKDGDQLLAGPDASELTGLAGGYVAAVVCCDAGQLEVSDLVTFWRHRSRESATAERSPKSHKGVQFVGAPLEVPHWAGLATECRIHIETPSETDAFHLHRTDKPDVVLCAPSVEACANDAVHSACQDLAPGEVEVSITNFSRRLAAPLPYSVHYQWLFKLLAARLNPRPLDLDAATRGWTENLAAQEAVPWIEELTRHLKAVKDPEDQEGHVFPFPVIPSPLEPPPGKLMDAEDRAICPFIEGGA